VREELIDVRPLDTTAGADHRVGRDAPVREERVAQLRADEFDQSAALTRIPVGVELDLVVGARTLRADENRIPRGLGAPGPSGRTATDALGQLLRNRPKHELGPMTL
jgi:hypothetical protein